MSQPDAPAQTPAAPTGVQHTAAGARSAILSRPNKLKDRLVMVHGWADQLPTVEREVNGEKERGNVLVIELTGLRRAELLQHAAEGAGKVELKRIYPDMVIASAHHPETRERLFEDADRDALLEDSGSAIETVATLAGQLSGLDDKAGKSAEGN